MYPGVWAASCPERAAVIMGESGEVMSYADLERGSNRLANFLHAQGIEPGMHVAIFMENNLRYLEVVWAGLRSGLYITPVNRYMTAAEATYVVQDCGARALIASSRVAEVAEEVVNSCEALRISLMVGGDEGRLEDYEGAIADQPTAPLPEQPRGQFMLYSSGTTGRPKGILRPLSGRSITEEVPGPSMFGQLYGLDDQTIYLSPAPLYHAAPLTFSTNVHALGGTVVVMERFDEMQALQLIERYQVTASQWVPTMFVRMLKHPESERSAFDLSSQRIAIHAAAPCPIPIKEQMIEWWGPILVEYYSGTEGIGMTMCTSSEWLTHKGSVGRPVSGVIHICDKEGVEVPIGETGTVYFEQLAPSFEYHGDAEKTAGSRHAAHPNWMTMDDIGHVDSDGYLYLTDRASFTIISGGVNIYPQEIENVLVLHDAVLDAAVIGIPNNEFGEEVKAVIELVPGRRNDDSVYENIVAFCRERLSGYKVPRSIDVVSALPRLPTGKLYKKALRDQYVHSPMS